MAFHLATLYFSLIRIRCVECKWDFGLSMRTFETTILQSGSKKASTSCSLIEFCWSPQFPVLSLLDSHRSQNWPKPNYFEDEVSGGKLRWKACSNFATNYYKSQVFLSFSFQASYHCGWGWSFPLELLLLTLNVTLINFHLSPYPRIRITYPTIKANMSLVLVLTKQEMKGEIARFALMAFQDVELCYIWIGH